MQDKFLEVKCPECDTILIVHNKTGEVVEVRKKLIEDSTGDRFEDAWQKVKRSGSEIERKVEEAKAREREKMDRLNQMFKDGIKKAESEGPVTKPERDFDLD